MELRLVDFEQAKGLKDAGFPQRLRDCCYIVKEYHDDCYDYYPGDIIYFRQYIRSDWVEDYHGISEEHLIEAPSLELASKWLREEKNLWIEITHGGYPYSAHCFVNDYIYEDSTHIKEFSSYEEALSAGIDKAIEKIYE